MRFFSFLLILLMSSLLAVPSAYAANINIVTTEGVTMKDITNTARAIQYTGTYMYTHYQKRLETDVSLTIRKGTRAQIDESGSFTRNGDVTVAFTNEDSDYREIFLVAHELIHQYQLDAVIPDTLNKNIWFTEGMADYLAMQIANMMGKDQSKTFQNYGKRGLSYGIKLSEICSRTRWNFYSKDNNLYPLADFAMYELFSRYSAKNPFAYLLILQTHSADEAMRLTYGISMDNLLDGAIKSK